MKEQGYNIFQRAYNGVKAALYNMRVALHGKIAPKAKKESLQAKGIKSHRRLRELVFIWGGLSVPIANFILFYFIANFSALGMAFSYITPAGRAYGFQNFHLAGSLLTQAGSIMQEAVLNTLIYFAFNFFIILPLCYIIAYFIFKKIWGHGFFRYLFFLPSIISAVIMASFFKYMTQPGGPLTELLSKMMGREILLLADSRTALGTLLLYNLWLGFGVQLIYFTANLQRIPKEILESARLEGVTPWQEIRYILFPLTWPFYSTMMFLSLTAIFSSGGAALLLTKGSYGTYDFGYWMYVQVTSGGESQLYLASALGWMLTAVSLPLSLVFKRIADKVEVVEY